jgi:hypothetical protein
VQEDSSVQTAIIALIIFLPIILVWLIVVLILKIAKSLSLRTRKQKTRKQKTRKQKTRNSTALSQELNGAEIIFTIFFVMLLVFLIVSVPKEHSGFIGGLGSVFGSLLVQGHQHKQNQKKRYPTIEDIRLKYPKRKPVDIPTDGIYEDFSRELTPVDVETIELEVSENSYKTLLRMVYGDTELAHNLITGNLFKGRSATWACEKAISDLERDRR